MTQPYKGNPELRRAYLCDGLDALYRLCANQRDDSEVPLGKVSSLIRVLSEEARIVCFELHRERALIETAND